MTKCEIMMQVLNNNPFLFFFNHVANYPCGPYVKSSSTL